MAGDAYRKVSIVGIMASSTPWSRLAAIGGALAILLFCAFTLASAARYPGPFSPLDNWLSDLGTASKNPLGYAYFNMGCILTAASLLLLMAGMGAWLNEDKRNKGLLALSRACGALSAVSLVLVGAFDEDTPYHTMVSVAFFVLMTLFLLLANVALWKHPAYGRWIGYCGVAAIAVGVVFGLTFFAFDGSPALEWLSVFSGLGWAGLFAYNTARLDAMGAG